MRNILIFLLLSITWPHNANGQLRVVKGRVALQDLEKLYTRPCIQIWTKDSVLLGETDNEGRFVIALPQKDQIILFSGLGVEWTNIQLADSCNSVEIVLLIAWHLDFMSLAKMNKFRKREFNKLPKLHAEGVANGLFTQQHICYARSFEPYK